MQFEEALKHVLRHEGGYSDHPSDPGGRTNYGITERVARQHGYQGDMRNIPMGTVRDIYRRSYWQAANCDRIPDHLRLIHFDSAVNSGVTRAARWLQESVGSAADGIIGPNTLAAAQMAGPGAAGRYAAVRLEFLAGLSAFGTFGRGWTRRVADVLKSSV